jgi:hypothetical protein
VRIVVLDCFTRMGMSVINSVDRSYELIGAAPGYRGTLLRRSDRVLRSPRLSDVFDYPHANVDPAGFQDAILGACERYEPDAIFPASTASAYGLARLRRDVGYELGTTLVVDDYAHLVRLADKWRLYELCEKLGIPAPRTFLPTAGLDIAGALGLPVVVKPRLGEGSRGLRIAATAEELDTLLAAPPRVGGLPDEGHPYVVQEFLRGQIHNVGACMVRGRPVSMMTQQRVLTRHEFGGSGLVHRTTLEPEITEYARTLLAEVSWSGPVLLEFLRDEDGRFYLIDGNPRVWTSTELTVAAGMNVCQQAVDIFVRGKEPPAVTEYRVGLTLRWISAGAIAVCLRRPRTPSAVWSRLRLLLAPRRPSTTFTNLRIGNLRHLAGLTLHHAIRSRSRQESRQPERHDPRGEAAREGAG